MIKQDEFIREFNQKWGTSIRYINDYDFSITPKELYDFINHIIEKQSANISDDYIELKAKQWQELTGANDVEYTRYLQGAKWALSLHLLSKQKPSEVSEEIKEGDYYIYNVNKIGKATKEDIKNGVLKFCKKVELSPSLPTDSKEKWISVDERLPEIGGHYAIIAPKSFPKNCEVIIAEFDKEANMFYSESSDYAVKDATHWMTLPELPINKEGGTK